MPAEEIPFRVGEQVQRTLGRLSPDAAPPPAGNRVDTGLAELVLGWGRRAGVVDYWAEQATAVAQGDVTVFGRRCATTPGGIPDWDVDPMTGYRWPQNYCFDVRLTPGTSPPVEVKYVWELNRLVYLIPAAAHAASTGDEQVSQLCRAHLEDWIRTHPARRGVGWRSGIELAIRVLAIVTVLELTTTDPGAEPALEALAGRTVADHADWIRRFPSRYSSANNHRVAELAGLLIAASAYPDLAPAAEVDGWWTEFEATVLLQFHADGVPAEQATMYALLVLEWVAICLRLARREGREVSADVRERVASAAGFVVAVTDVGGHVVRFGDDDDSRLLTAALPHDDLPGAVLGLVAEGLGVPVPLARPGLFTYAEGGYTVWRAGTAADEVLWVLDHGVLGMGNLAAHAHADTLAVYLHLGGRPVLIDAGTYLYHSDGGWRDRLRRTEEHNTVAVGLQDSSVMVGPFNWRQGARAVGRLVTATSSAEQWCVEAEHHGYATRYGIVHRRFLRGFGSRSFRLSDCLEGGTAGLPFRWSLLVAPGLEVSTTASGWRVRADGTDLLEVSVPRRWNSLVDMEPAWCSPTFGSLEPTSRLMVVGDVAGTSSTNIDISISVA